jgi:hypothetical protein
MMRPTLGCGARPAVCCMHFRMCQLPWKTVRARPQAGGVGCSDDEPAIALAKHAFARRREMIAPGLLAACLGPASRNAPLTTQRDYSTCWTRKRHSHGPSLAAERAMAVAAAGVGYDAVPVDSCIRRVSETSSETIRRLWHTTWAQRFTRRASWPAHDDEGEVAEGRINCRNFLGGRREIVPVHLGSFPSERIVAGSRLPQTTLARIVCSFRGGQCLLYVFRPVVAPCCPPALPTSIDQ